MKLLHQNQSDLRNIQVVLERSWFGLKIMSSAERQYVSVRKESGDKLEVVWGTDLYKLFDTYLHYVF